MGKTKGGRGAAVDLAAQMQRLQEELVQAQAALAEEVVEVGAGGGAVHVVMSGTQECRALKIAPQLLAEGDVQIIEDLVVLAVNQALQESRLLAARRLGPLSGALGGAGLLE